MQKLLPAALVIILLFSLAALHGGAKAVTTVSGDITWDTVWRQSNSPYQLTGPVTVKAGVTLTIEQGVTVNLNNQYIQINGKLVARGTISQNIVFTSTGTGQFINLNKAEDDSIIENAVIEKSYVYIESCSPTINNNTFCSLIDCAITAKDGESTISNNVFYDLNYYSAIIASTAQRVTNNRIYGSFWQYGIQASDNAYIANNMVSGCWSAIKASGNSVIEGNVLVDAHNRAIDVTESTVTIKSNYIAGNPSYGIVGGGTIESNTLYNNTVGIYVSLSASITDNNFIGNGNNQTNIYLATSENVNAEYNWWGSTNTQTIRQTIYDRNDYANLGIVDFEPILTQPSQKAPTEAIIDIINENRSGGFYFYVDSEIQSIIMITAQATVVTLTIVWSLIATVLVFKRFRITRRNP